MNTRNSAEYVGFFHVCDRKASLANDSHFRRKRRLALLFDVHRRMYNSCIFSCFRKFWSVRTEFRPILFFYLFFFPSEIFIHTDYYSFFKVTSSCSFWFWKKKKIEIDDFFCSIYYWSFCGIRDSKLICSLGKSQTSESCCNTRIWRTEWTVCRRSSKEFFLLLQSGICISVHDSTDGQRKETVNDFCIYGLYQCHFFILLAENDVSWHQRSTRFAIKHFHTVISFVLWNSRQDQKKVS